MEEEKEVKIIAQKTVAKYIISLREDGILHCHIFKETEWRAEEYELFYTTIGEVCNYKKVPMMLTYENFTFPTLEAINYWGNPDTACPYISVEALVLDTLSLKILGDFYAKQKSSSRISKVFENKKEAIKWLLNFNGCTP